MKLKNIILLSFLAVAATALTASADILGPGAAYSVNSITLPFSTLAAATPGSTTSTNLGAGWSAVVSVTNTATTWNSSSNAFISVTNVISTTNTVYADMSIDQQKDLGIAVGYKAGASSAIATYTFAPMLDSSTVDSSRTFTLAPAANATNIYSANSVIATTNLSRNDIGGYGKIRLLKVDWAGTNSVAFTNNFFKYGIKRGAE